MHPLFLALLLISSLPIGALAATDDGPSPPCDGAAWPAYPAPEAPPAVQLWHGADLDRAGWRPPACSGWPDGSRSKLVVGLAASFRFEGTLDALLARIGAISTLPSMRYWSITDGAWRPLAVGAAALTQPDKASRRPDFSAAEMTAGREFFYLEDDSRSGAIVYRMRIRELSPRRAVIATENLTSVRLFLLPLFAPGALQSVEYIEELGPAIWGVYILTRAGEGTSWLAGGHDGSYVNRAVAVFRHLADIPTDAEPPAAR